MDEFVRRAPRFFAGFAHNDVQANTKTQRTTAFRRPRADVRDLLRHLGRRLAPRQIHVHLLRRQVVGCVRGSAEIQRRVGLLHRGKQGLRTFDAQMPALVGHGLAAQNGAPDAEELVGRFVALTVIEEEAVAGELDRIAAGHHIDEQPAIGEPVERSSHARGHAWRHEPRTHGDQEPQLLRHPDQTRCRHPRVFARTPGGDERAVVAERVRGDRDPLQVIVVHRARALRRTEVTAIAMSGEEPEDFGLAHLHFTLTWLPAPRPDARRCLSPRWISG